MAEIGYWIEAHSLLFLLAFSAVFTFFWLMWFRERLGLRPWNAAVFSVLHVVIGVIAVSLFAALENPKEYSFGVQSLFGGVFFMPLVYGLWARLAKRSYADVFDICTVCLVFTLMCARINCLISGCCIGKLILGTDRLCWPTREAEILFYIGLLTIIIPMVFNKKKSGALYPMYMMSYGGFRFVIEFFRRGNGLFHLSHMWALASFCIGAGFLLEFNTKKVRK